MNTGITKTLLVMANSIKKYPDRCVAGLEMIPRGGNFALGKWIRPVDPSQPEGAIPFQRTVIGGQTVCPLHCVEMTFTRPANDPCHPEDWILESETNWKIVGKYDHSILDRLPDQSGDLWGPQSAASRQVPRGAAAVTLRLIRPKQPVLVEAFYEYDSFKGKDQFKKILTIRHDGVDHLFSITDPLFDQRHGLSPGRVSKGETRRFDLKPENLVIVASLTPPLANGFQYKIAAAILEP
ncbi:MAG: hypothetical protein WCP45_14560 [Verrucomicrobiota bacterium]